MDTPVLPPGALVRVSIGDAAESQQRVTARVLEQAPDSSLRLDWPGGTHQPPSPGVEVWVEVPHARQPSSAPMRVEEPRPPDTSAVRLRPIGPWRRAQRRTGIRAPVTARPTRVERRGEDGWHPVEGVVMDLSARGVRFRRTDGPLHVGDHLRFSWAVEPDRPELSMTAHVVRTTPRSEHGAREAVAGCRFVDLTAEQASRLARFIFAQQRAASHAS